MLTQVLFISISFKKVLKQRIDDENARSIYSDTIGRVDQYLSSRNRCDHSGIATEGNIFEHDDSFKYH